MIPLNYLPKMVCRMSRGNPRKPKEKRQRKLHGKSILRSPETLKNLTEETSTLKKPTVQESPKKPTSPQRPHEPTRWLSQPAERGRCGSCKWTWMPWSLETESFWPLQSTSGNRRRVFSGGLTLVDWVCLGFGGLFFGFCFGPLG